MIIVSSFNAKTLPNVHELLPSMEPLVLIVPRDTKLDDLSTFISRLQYNYPGILVIAPLHIACHHGSFCSEECDSSTTLSTQFPFINIVYFLKGRVRTSFAKEFTKTLIKQLGEWTDANPRSVDYAFRSTLQMMKSLDQLPSTRVPNNYDLRTTKAYPSLDILEDLYFQLLQSFGHSGPNDDELFNIWRDNCRFKMMVKPKDMEFHIWILCWMFGKESYDTFRHRMGFQELDPKTIPKNFIMAHVLACWINWLHHPILRLRTIFDITQHKNQYMVQLQILSNVPNQRGVSPSIGPAIQLAYQIAMHISGDVSISLDEKHFFDITYKNSGAGGTSFNDNDKARNRAYIH